MYQMPNKTGFVWGGGKCVCVNKLFQKKIKQFKFLLIMHDIPPNAPPQTIDSILNFFQPFAISVSKS